MRSKGSHAFKRYSFINQLFFMKHPISIELLEKYVNGGCSPEEIAVVKKWYFSFEDDIDHVSDLTEPELVLLEEQIYNQILHKIGFDEQVLSNQPVMEQRRKYGLWYAAVGVAAVLLAYVAIIFNNKPVSSGDKQLADAGIQEFVLITNNTHQIYKKALPDNSTVWLSPGSQIKFPKVFDQRYRAISMSGECFFEVTKNPKRPFVINSGSIITKVWGTSFRVHDDIKDKQANVSVITGKVSVSINQNKTDNVDYSLNKNEVMLYPHQKVVYLASKNILKPQIADESNMQIWARVNLAFENKPLSDIVPVLNSKFHVHIKVVNEKLNHYILNADMAGFNLPDVLEALKKSLNVSYEIHNNEIDLE